MIADPGSSFAYKLRALRRNREKRTGSPGRTGGMYEVYRRILGKK